MKLFDYIACATYLKTELDFSNEDVYKGYSQFSINRALSMCKELLSISVMLNVIPSNTLTNEEHYKLLLSAIPQKRYKIEYVKSSVDKETEELLRYVIDYYDIGTKDAKIVLSSLQESDIDEILRNYSYGKKKTIII